MSRKKSIALVLGAGSAKGLAHIGVLQILEEHGISVDIIVGCSMGAMVGGIYACGTNLKMLDKLLESMNTNILYDVNIPRFGFMAGKKILHFLRLLTKNYDFRQLRLPFYAVATDIVNGQTVVLDKGTVAEAIRASISIPGIFTPVSIDDMILVDGAVTEMLPVNIARELGGEVIIAVDVGSGSIKRESVKNAFDVIMASVDIMQKRQFQLIKDQTDVLIQPMVEDYSARDFHRSRELIDLGREAALKSLPKIRRVLKSGL